MTTSNFREPAMLGRTGRLITDQSESDKIVSPQNLSDSDRLQLWITLGRYTKTDTINIHTLHTFYLPLPLPPPHEPPYFCAIMNSLSIKN